MPYLDNNNPLVNKNAPGTPHGSGAFGGGHNQPQGARPLYGMPKKVESEDKLLKGSRISVYEFKRALEGKDGNVKIREELAKEFKVKPYSPEMNTILKEMEDKIPARAKADGYISASEAHRALDIDEPWNEKHDLQQKMKGGITQQENWDMARHKQEGGFLRRLFGLNKK